MSCEEGVPVRSAGVDTSDTVGMSSENYGEKP